MPPGFRGRDTYLSNARHAAFPLAARAAHEGKVTWRARHVNILPAAINGNQQQSTAVSGFKFQVHSQGAHAKARRREERAFFFA